jgi:NADPH:quinone reductase
MRAMAMRAMLLEQLGGFEALQMRDYLAPKIQQKQDLLIQLRAAGVNPIDTKLRTRGTFYPDRMPAILGCDGAGIVLAVGSEAQAFQVGDEVYFCHGGLEYVVTDERFVAHKPKSLSFTAAAAAPLVIITAWEALVDRAGLRQGQTVLIHAGAGGVGHVAIQLAKLKGATVLTTVSTDQKAEFVKRLGADHVIQYGKTDVVEAVMDLTSGMGVDISFDTVGGKILSQCFRTTRHYGDVVTILAADDQTDWSTARNRNLRVSFELMLTPMLKGLTTAQMHQVEILNQCAQWFDAGQLSIELDKIFPLEAAAEAHKFLESGLVQGKVVLSI